MLTGVKGRRVGVARSVGLHLLACVAASAFADPALTPAAKLYVDPSSTTAHAAESSSGAARADAMRLARYPSATWFTQGTPAEVRASVKALVDRAAEQHAVPVLVAYNLPFRDCSQYSAGGAKNTAAYQVWIDALAAGIGDRPAVVIVEPDGLGIIPFNTDLSGKAEWCKPAEADARTAFGDRYAALNHAVDALKANAHTEVYLDGTHSGWLGVGDIADRLVKAGVQRADGFFLNVSNYQPTAQSLRFGHWVAQCIGYASDPSGGGKRLGQYKNCASQYHPADSGDFATWAKSDQWYAQNMSEATLKPGALKRFVIDTSRNGQGAWAPPAGTNYKDPQVWCNPPNRGLGLRPTTRTGDDLLSAYLWIKVPGESDGQCDRGMGGPIDPARGVADPAAGAWFAKQAAELIELAVPKLAR